MKYKFEQFNIEIVDPIIVIDYENVLVNNLTKTILSVNICLKTSNGSKFGITLEDISIGDSTWDDVDMQTLVQNELNKYKI